MSTVRFPPKFTEKISPTTPGLAEVIFFEQFNPSLRGGNGHPHKMMQLVDGMTGVDFEAQGLDSSLTRYADLEAGTTRIMAFQDSWQHDVPVGSYLMTARSPAHPAETAPAIGPAVFAREDTESYLSRSRSTKVLAKLRLRSRDSGTRFFTSWIVEQPPQMADRVLSAAIDIAQLAGLNTLKIVQVPTAEHPRLTVVEQAIDPTDPRFGFTGGNLGTAVIEGNKYTGAIFTRELR